MAEKVRLCSICAAPYELRTLPRLSVEEAPLKVSVDGMPALVCPKGHQAPVHRDFLLWLIRELRGREGALPCGREEGMLFKKRLCGACGKELASRSEGQRAFPFDLAFPDAPAFRAEIELPLYKCTGCGKEQVRSAKELHGNAAAAVASLSDAARFPHSG